MAEGETVEKPVAALVKYLNERKVHIRDKGKVSWTTRCQCCVEGMDADGVFRCVCCFRGKLASRSTRTARVVKRARRM
jgi:hypothetical protein